MHEHAARILLVDDDTDTRGVMTRLLRQEGYDVLAAGTCEAAVRSAADGPVDLLITDMLLPDGDGVSVLTRLRELHDVEGILVSGLAAEDQGIGAERFARRLIKPVAFPGLLGAIDEVLAHRAG